MPAHAPQYIGQDKMAFVIAEGLLRVKARRYQRAHPPSLLAWVEKHRWMRGEQFRVPCPLREIYEQQAPEVAIRKAAQVGASEWLVNLALWGADVQAGGRGNVLYVQPAKETAGDFVRARFDPAIEDSEYLQQRARPRAGVATVKNTDNVGLKRIGRGFIYFRGSNAESGLVTVDADLVLYDEVDRLKQGTMALGQKRLGSSALGWQRYASTPIYPESGIDSLWLASTQRSWFLKCEHCGHRQTLTWPANLLEDGTVVCAACRKPIDRLAQGEWVPARPSAAIEGYHLTKLFGDRADLAAVAKTGYRIERRDETDHTVIQQWWNQDMGLPHAPEGGQLSRAELQAAMADYSLRDWPWAKPVPQCTMGVDIGAKLHVIIGAPAQEGRRRVAYIGTVPDFDALDSLMARFDVRRCVVDAEPEHHGAAKFAARFRGRVWLCHYPNVSNWPHKDATVWRDDEFAVNAHRTMTLDSTFAAVRERRLDLPAETMAIPDFAEQMMAPVRVLEKDARGNPVAVYLEGGRADHYAHAANYESIAASRKRSAHFG